MKRIGLERGATAVRTIALLPALTGSWKEVGGGLQLSLPQAHQLNRAGLERADLQQKSLGRAKCSCIIARGNCQPVHSVG